MYPMIRALLLSSVCLLVLGPVLSAEKPGEKSTEKTDKPARPVGNWTREVSGRTITFTIKPDTLTISLSDGDHSVTVKSAYSTVDDTLFGIVTDVEKKGTDGGPEKGDLFRFRFKVDKNTLTLSDLGGQRAGEEAKKIIEGEYKKN